MNKEQAKEFRTKMANYAKEEFGVDLDIGNITYWNNHFRFSAKVFNGLDGRREEFEKNCGKKGVPASWFNKVFIADDGKKFKIVAVKPRGRKNVLGITDINSGKDYVCPVGYVRAGRFIDQQATPTGIAQEGGVLV